METIPVGFRLEKDLVDKIDVIAERTGVTRTDVLHRCVRLGLEADEEFANMGPLMQEVINLLSSPRLSGVLAGLADRQVDPKQLERVKYMRDKRKAKGQDGKKPGKGGAS